MPAETVASLRCNDLSVSFGGVRALQNFSMETSAGEIVGLVGPNGAGKSTAFNVISGFVRPQRGRVLLGDRDLTRSRPDAVARAGVRRTFQNIRLFASLTVLENVMAGAATTHSARLADVRRQAREILDQVRLADVARRLPGELPYAFQRRVEIARCLIANPKVLLLDEPAAGMHTEERSALVELLRSEISRQIAVVLVEHDMALVAAACHRVYVLDFGQTIAIGTPAEAQADERVIRAYLGTDEE